MAFKSTLLATGTVMGNRRISFGTYSNVSSGTGGNVDTGIYNVESFLITPTGAADTAIYVNTTLPTSGSTIVTIVTGSTLAGNWFAIGY